MTQPTTIQIDITPDSLRRFAVAFHVTWPTLNGKLGELYATITDVLPIRNHMRSLGWNIVNVSLALQVPTCGEPMCRCNGKQAVYRLTFNAPPKGLG